jgi:two-component system, chemotaxis family, CheB/CheR fusion protein
MAGRTRGMARALLLPTVTVVVAGRTGAVQILVADDNKAAREVLSEFLTIAGHHVHRAADGLEALAVATREQLDVAILDIDMPGLSGWEVAARMRDLGCGPNLRLVALSGRSSPEDMAASTLAGFDAHLVKPTSLGDITQSFAGVPGIDAQVLHAG